jgi:hypothetical protein
MAYFISHSKLLKKLKEKMVGDFLKGVAILSTKTENPIRRPYPLQEVSLSFKKD